MGEGTRDAFLKRISTVGTGTREVIQMLLGELVLEVRDQVARGVFADDELDQVVEFHDRAEDLWRHSLATNPPLQPDDLQREVDALEAAATGTLTGFGIQLEIVKRKVEDLVTAHRTRREETTD